MPMVLRLRPRKPNQTDFNGSSLGQYDLKIYQGGKKELGHRFHSFINSKGIQLVTATQKVGCYVTNGYLQIIVFSLRGLLDVCYSPQDLKTLQFPTLSMISYLMLKRGTQERSSFPNCILCVSRTAI